MPVAVFLDNPPEFYTSLDTISGRVVLSVSGQPEHISSISVKLEGEAQTVEFFEFLEPVGSVPPGAWPSRSIYPKLPGTGSLRRLGSGAVSGMGLGSRSGPPIFNEDHKIVYKVQRLFPNAADADAGPGPCSFDRGVYEYPFQFTMPINNSCGERAGSAHSPAGSAHSPAGSTSSFGYFAGMGSSGGGGGSGGGTGVDLRAAGQSLLGLVGGGMRAIDNWRHEHVSQMLPPTTTQERIVVRYYAKVTVKRPGLLNESWRHSVGFRFVPAEPPRPPPSLKEIFARRPFTFGPTIVEAKYRGGGKTDSQAPLPPSVMIQARLPFPPILTRNKSIPLRILSTKKNQVPGDVHLVGLQIDLVAVTKTRCLNSESTDANRWMLLSHQGIRVPLTRDRDAPAESEVELDDWFWRDVPVPGYIMPSFWTCHARMTYSLEIKLGVHWKPPEAGVTETPGPPPQGRTLFLPLQFREVEVYSGIRPATALGSNGVGSARPSRNRGNSARYHQTVIPGSSSMAPPPLPPRQRAASGPPVQMPISAQQQPDPPRYTSFATGHPISDDLPPSYEEAMAEAAAGPFDGTGQGGQTPVRGVEGDTLRQDPNKW